ncbi:MAG: hypothetical protein ACJAVK_001580 [Akkermansiaceae bacterium]|jgi:hypothetical protein
MREFLIVLACIIIAIALRSCRTLILRKIGALTFLVASFVTLYFALESVCAGSIGVALWFFLPWFDLLTRIRHLRIPFDNRLELRAPPSEDHFPNASRLIREIEDAEFDHVTDSGWDWVGMHQYFRFFWNPEARAVAAVCLCEHEQVAFAFVTVSARSPDGRTIHTTNYPFSPTLKHPPEAHWDHLPCERNRFDAIFKDHLRHLQKMKIDPKDLLMPDPDEMLEEFESEMKKQITHNLECGIIRMTDDDYFQYSTKGLFFLWFQSVKDMIRLC